MGGVSEEARDAQTQRLIAMNDEVPEDETPENNVVVQTMNKRVACAPFERTSIEVANPRGFAVVKQKQELTQLKVVFDTDDETFHVGDRIAVFGSSCAAAWAKEVYEIGGKKFILVPVGEIVAVIR